MYSRQFFFDCIFFTPLVILIYLLTDIPNDTSFGISNFFILLITYFGFLAKKDRPYSLEKIVYIFAFVFFGIVPLNDMANENIYWTGNRIDSAHFITTNVIIIIGLLAFTVGSKLKIVAFDRTPNLFPTINKVNIGFYFFLLALVGFLILQNNEYSIPRVLFRGLASEFATDSDTQSSQIQTLIFRNFIRPMPFVLLAVFVFYYKSNSTSMPIFKRFRFRVYLVLSIVLAILLVAPTSVPRFQAAALYIPLILMFTSIWNRHYSMQLSTLAGLFLVMPFLDKFRYFNPETFDWSIDLDFLNHGHFDAYQNFVRVIEIDFVTYGQQLVGALRFFIPRGIWEEKPVGSGATLSYEAGYDFSNISMPFMAEGYVNFGIFGVILFMFSLGVVISNIDRISWKLKKNQINHFILYYYYFLFGMIFFVMRGDLMSSFAYTVGLTASFLTIAYILNFFAFKARPL